MDNFKGTKGEWFYQEGADAYTHIVRPKLNPSRIISHLSQDTSGQAEADARLIAAAPSLLESAISVLDGFNAGITDELDNYDRLIKLRLAVNKALGKETKDV